MGSGLRLLQLCLVLVICLHFAEHATAAVTCRVQDKASLLAFRKTLVPDLSPSDSDCVPYTWDNTTDCCNWDGIECNNSTGSVVSVFLGNSCSRGSSSSFSSNSPLFQLSSLQTLDLTGLKLPTSIPKEIAKLHQLQSLSLGANGLTGTIPAAVGNLNQLRWLSLFFNDLSGSIPPSLSNLKHLETLDISNCKLTGSIPAALFNNPNLDNIHLQGNQLTGSLPANTSVPSRLAFLELTSNRLEGKIPSWLFEIPSLFFLFLGNNSFAGPLEPFRKPQPTSMLIVDLSFNKITGTFPSSFFQLSELTTLNLQATQLSGVVEWSGFKNMVNLTSLDLSENRGLTLKNNGGAQFNLGQFQELKIASCSVTEFPAFLSGFKRLLLLDVSDNKISGAVFQEQGWQQLQTFNGSHNQITSFKFPKSDTLFTFDLSYNLLKGSLPKQSPQFTPLGELYLSNNQFSGGIPTEYCKIKDELDLSYNNLSGGVPTCFNTNDFFRILHLQNNKLSGVIPSSIGNGTSLTSLDLSRNQLTGNIPPILMSLTTLEDLNLSYNKLYGPIPKGPFPNSSYIGNPGLCGPPLTKKC